MNAQQTRALWCAAFRSIADAIEAGLTDAPTSVHLWTQFVSPMVLADRADTSYRDPLPIKSAESEYPHIVIPVGEPLELALDWTVQAKRPNDEQLARLAGTIYQQHNAGCVGA